MYKKLSYLLFWVMLTSNVQACAASENKINTSQVSRPQTADSQNSKKPAPESRDAAYASSRYKPEGLLVSIDFEDEEVKPVKGSKGKYDMLVLQTPTGEATAVGIYYEDGNDSDRRARIAVDPENSQNHVYITG